MYRTLKVAAATLLSACSALAHADEQTDFIDAMAKQHGFDRAALRDLLDQAERRQDILDAISRPAEGKPWWQYERIFLTDARADGGVAFWDENADLLAKAEQHYGVPAEIIVAIIGVETFYGRHTGKYRVLDALSTLGFHYPKRGRFFRKQLGEFLLLAREEGVDPTVPLGSYAGAMGRPQFIPSSFRHYAADFDGDGKRDIWNNNADVIGSVANYFALHQWQPGAPVVYPARLDSPVPDQLVQSDSKPRATLGELNAAGIRIDADLPADTPVSLFALDEPDGVSHWVGLTNFYVITRYNHSNLYAMAVYQLAQRIKAQREAADAATAAR